MDAAGTRSAPAIHVEYLAWESDPGVTLTTYIVPSPGIGVACAIGLLGMSNRRRVT
ncbi:MAG: hypothetical protein ACYTF7_10440 [Planctomycetota bacterium]|jgi:hypothetical protein